MEDLVGETTERLVCAAHFEAYPLRDVSTSITVLGNDWECDIKEFIDNVVQTDEWTADTLRVILQLWVPRDDSRRIPIYLPDTAHAQFGTSLSEALLLVPYNNK